MARRTLDGQYKKGYEDGYRDAKIEALAEAGGEFVAVRDNGSIEVAYGNLIYIIYKGDRPMPRCI
jgi:hypothetical protein